MKILWKREIAPKEQFLFSAIFYSLLLDFHVYKGTRFSLRDKRLFEISEVEITRVDCTSVHATTEVTRAGSPVNYQIQGMHICDCVGNSDSVRGILPQFNSEITMNHCRNPPLPSSSCVG